MTDLQLAVKTTTNTVLSLTNLLKQPELVDLAMALPLDQVGPFLNLLTLYVNIQLVEMTLYHIYFPSPKNIPPLVVTVVAFP